jgi:hypothetical protein
MSGIKTFYTYELIDSRDGSVFYVGKGHNKRMYQHVAMVKANRKMNRVLKQRIETILALNCDVIYHKALETPSESEAFRKEAELIEHYGLENLCNIAKAGPGWSDMDCEKLRKVLSEQSKLHAYKGGLATAHRLRSDKEFAEDFSAISSRSMKEKHALGKIKYGLSFVNKHHSERTKSILSEKAKQRTNPMLGRHHTEETRQKISKALKQNGYQDQARGDPSSYADARKATEG